MNPKVIEAARFIATDDNGDDVCAEERARRVLLAQAECVSDGAVAKAVEVFWDLDGPDEFRMRAAIAAALRFEAGE
jgi:hypothetical protein